MNVTAENRQAAEQRISGVYVRPRCDPFSQPDGGVVLVGVLADGRVVRGYLDDPDRLRPGTEYTFLGAWDVGCRHGPQFAFAAVTEASPATRDGVVSWLCRNAPGIGKHTAGRLWDAYGESALDVLRDYPEHVAQDGILGFDRALAVAEALRAAGGEDGAAIRLFALLGGRGFPSATLQHILDNWDGDPAKDIAADPFEMIRREVPGVGFARADSLHLQLGHDPAAPGRQVFAAWHLTNKACSPSGDSHTWVPAVGVEGGVEALVGEGADGDLAVADAVDAGLLERQDKWLALPRFAEAERDVVANVHRVLLEGRPMPWLPADDTLSPHQRDAEAAVLAQPFALLLGLAGVGKTHLSASIIRRAAGRMRLAVCCPTGKAASRLNGKLAGCGVKARTIHSLLDGRPGRGGAWFFGRDARNPLAADMVVVDEASMVDLPTLAALLAAVKPGARVLLVGDPGQLAPVGNGAPLRDLIDAGVPSFTLTEILRNAGAVVRACHAIREGRPFEIPARADLDAGDNLALVRAGSASEVVEAVVRVVEHARDKRPRWDASKDLQVVCARNDTRDDLNRRLREVLNPGPGGGDEPFRTGDRVINLDNRTIGGVYLANGDTGTVRTVKRAGLVVEFTDPVRVVEVPVFPADTAPRDGRKKARALDLAYALTVHKAQGSEWPVVVLAAEPGQTAVCGREWAYTALSRARELCVVVGERQTLDGYAARPRLGERRTHLRELLTY